ncbi:MAG: hypothetical protein OXN86_03670 [Chloroflexota bacterium]|nr:hypothetical protein [Chloroflexota bacterium]
MRRLLLVPLTLVLLAVACGSGDEARPNTGTATSERAERQATVAQQQEAAVQEDAEAVEAGQETQSIQQVQQQQQSAVEVEQQHQIQPTQEETEGEEQVDELPSEIVGVHKGVRSERNVLGEPDAPVEIRYFGDFT